VHTEAIFILLLVLATSVAIVTRRLKIPYTVALVLTGLVLGALHILEAPELTQEMLFSVFLPGLLFEAAYHMEYEDFRRHAVSIGALAVPGVVAATVITALVLTPAVGALHLVHGFGWQEGLLFGAVIAATDPIAVVALFKSVGAPRELSVLMEGESLLNDGTAIVVFTLILSVIKGTATGAGDLILEFGYTVGGGAALGVAVGLAVSEIVKRVDDPMIEITLTTIAAYGSFVSAEHFHVSGVIATVAAGMLCGNYAARQGMSPSTRIAVESFWDYTAFALNSMVFLLIGFEVSLSALSHVWLPIVVAYLAVLLSRGVVAGGVTALLRPLGRPIPWSWSAVLWWGGLRGGICMVLALSLSPSLPNRELLINMTFGVVTLVILAHGFTISPLLTRLGLTSHHEAREEYELARGRLHVAQHALRVIREMASSRTTDPSLIETIEEEYRARVDEEEEHLRSLHVAHAELRAGELGRALRQVLLAERRQATEAYRTGLVSHEVHQRLVTDIDARLTRAERDWMADAEDPNTEAPVERARELAGRDTRARRESPESGPPDPPSEDP